jgi:predicted RNase H-related nuclease YkuK (DUF458 family)
MASTAVTRFVIKVEGVGMLKTVGKRMLCITHMCTGVSVRGRIIHGFGLQVNSALECYEILTQEDEEFEIDLDFDSVVTSITKHLVDGSPVLADSVFIDCKSQITREVFNANSPNQFRTPVMVHYTAVKELEE